ncbi:MAG TPA: alpha/beta hydrolase [Acidimicrobiales bacterium]|nr:alpha/beta hydrolase [Acidimicrobiales bacterium]
MTHIELPFGPCEVHLDGHPDAPAVVLVHGLMVNSSLWDRVVPGLAAGHRVIRPDLPIGAHPIPAEHRDRIGPEDLADALAAMLDALGVEQAAVAGSDTGGALAQIFAARHPDRVRGLVLLSCDSLNHFPPTALKPMRPIMGLPGVVGLTGLSYRSRRIRRGPLGLGLLMHKPLDDDLVDGWFDRLAASAANRRDAAAFFRGNRPALTKAAAATLAETGLPVLLAWSADDRVFPESDARRLHAALPGSRLHFIEGARTFAQVDKPEAVLDLMLPFLAEAEAVSAGR